MSMTTIMYQTRKSAEPGDLFKVLKIPAFRVRGNNPLNSVRGKVSAFQDHAVLQIGLDLVVCQGGENSSPCTNFIFSTCFSVHISSPSCLPPSNLCFHLFCILCKQMLQPKIGQRYSFSRGSSGCS